MLPKSSALVDNEKKAASTHFSQEKEQGGVCVNPAVGGNCDCLSLNRAVMGDQMLLCWGDGYSWLRCERMA